MSPRMLTQDGAWPLDTERCPADHDFLSFLEVGEIEWASIFHMGPGGHHIVGMQCAKDGRSNSVISITNCREEASGYADWAERYPALTTYYKCYFGDVHMLDERQLPRFDFVTLFHLGEQGPADYARLSIAGVIAMLAGRLRWNGRMLFYRGSCAFDKVEPVIAPMIAGGWETQEFASLLALRKKP